MEVLLEVLPAGKEDVYIKRFSMPAAPFVGLILRFFPEPKVLQPNSLRGPLEFKIGENTAIYYDVMAGGMYTLSSYSRYSVNWLEECGFVVKR